MKKNLLKVEDLNTYFYTYDGIVKAVDGIDLVIREGETFGLVGESGCGKSVTALSILRLVQQPQGRIVKGRILFDGCNLLDLNESEMRDVRGNSVSMIFQEPMTSLNPVLRVGDQIAESIKIHEKTSRKAARIQTMEMLKKVGIPDPDRRILDYPHQLSGGMRQRIMIAMALACNPRLLIADEPTTALDVTIQAQILTLMNRLKDEYGASVLFITHDLSVIAETAQFVAVMYAGRIVETAPVVDLFQHPRHPYTLGLLASLPRMKGPSGEKVLKAIPGVVPNLLELPSGCRFQERCGDTFDRCRWEEPPLIRVVENHHVRCWKYESS
jgi:oligopeptide/dipeptide ABC transporter ATP-binding protein